MDWCWTTRVTTGADILRSTTNTPATWGKKPEIGCYICMEQHWKGTQGTIHQKSSQLFGDCRSRVRFRNPQSHPCFEQEHDLMRTGCQSFSLSLPPFCPILHSVSQAQPQPLVPPQASHPKLCLDSPSSLGNTRKCQIVSPYFKTQKNGLAGMDCLAWPQ